MEKRKWLWKRKSSERSPGETESSGSISSHSERFSDDQQEALKASPNHSSQSPEVTSKAVSVGEDINDSVRTLTEKLSAALVNVSAKEELVKQHAKVAEEAIAGWEKAENEVVVLKQKLEAAVQQNSTLEARVSHLDGALKECVRQLRQGREEQEQKIQEAVEKKTREWEAMKLELESQLLELQSKAESVKSEPPVQNDPDLSHMLELLKKENSALKNELLSQTEELEIRAIERDLSAQVAETASKQHLESIKKVAKLEAECRKLKAMACRSSSTNDLKSGAASSICVESLVDSQSEFGERLNLVEFDTHKISGSEVNKSELSCSDSWASALIVELDQFKTCNRNLPACSMEIDLMDDFLEMERLAAMHNNGSGNNLESEAVTKQSIDAESLLRAELEAMIHRTAELEEKVEKMMAEKGALEEIIEKMEAEKGILEEKIEYKEAEKGELLEKMEKLEAEKGELEGEMEKMEAEKAVQEEAMEKMEAEKGVLEEEMEKVEAEKGILEEEMEKMEAEKGEMELKLEKMEAEKGEMELKLEKMESEKGELEEHIKKMKVEKAELELSLTKSEDCVEASELLLRENKMKLEELERQINLTNESKQAIESKFVNTEVEVQTLSAKIDSLEDEVEKERALSAQITVKCQKLEEELWRTKQEVELQQIAKSNTEVKIKQEDLDVASGKLAECQKTIASLGKQLKSLATLEDFLIDTASIPKFPREGLSVPKAGGEPWKLHSNETFSPKRELTASSIAAKITVPSLNNSDGKTPPSILSSTSSAVSSNHVNHDKNRNGFAKFFSRTKNGIQLEL
ncbi:filament-like plant protein 1 isoform X1 [Mangifera indica]|uniref:filament-like plant protein 1 isoform X1 n=1 Tax=Mangifera indica TaxID=29780 RepID=UPI001CFBA78A|nr:filament-like plant protein 1 isoform X1 [Mangifera indica]XP_044475654.1 filament-like plant protein 1 isoform X1 [Mangifera indica]